LTNFLSTGESQYCECGHVVYDHEESYDVPMCTSPLLNTSAFYHQCNRNVSDSQSKCECSRCLSRCKCNRFTPYRGKWIARQQVL